MPTATPDELIQIAKEYLAAIERGAPFEEMAQFFTPDCVQEEFPNRFVPNGARRTMEDLKAAAGRGAKAVENQRYEVLNVLAHDNQVALEVQWSAQVLMPFGSLKGASEVPRPRPSSPRPSSPDHPIPLPGRRGRTAGKDKDERELQERPSRVPLFRGWGVGLGR